MSGLWTFMKYSAVWKLAAIILAAFQRLFNWHNLLRRVSWLWNQHLRLWQSEGCRIDYCWRLVTVRSVFGMLASNSSCFLDTFRRFLPHQMPRLCLCLSVTDKCESRSPTTHGKNECLYRDVLQRWKKVVHGFQVIGHILCAIDWPDRLAGTTNAIETNRLRLNPFEEGTPKVIVKF